MKKFFFLISLLMMSVAAHAVSTCETRVDKHQEATTKERVNYCLTPQLAPVPESDVPDLVYYGVINKKPTTKKENTSSRGPGSFEGKDLSVHRNYVGTEQFPELENDIRGEKELKELRERTELAQAEASQRLSGVKGSFALEKPQRQEAPAAQPQVIIKNDAKGISARMHKPGRMMRENAPEEETVTATPEADDEDIPSNNIAGEPDEAETSVNPVPALEGEDELLENVSPAQ